SACTAEEPPPLRRQLRPQTRPPLLSPNRSPTRLRPLLHPHPLQLRRIPSLLPRLLPPAATCSTAIYPKFRSVQATPFMAQSALSCVSVSIQMAQSPTSSTPRTGRETTSPASLSNWRATGSSGRHNRMVAPFPVPGSFTTDSVAPAWKSRLIKLD